MHLFVIKSVKGEATDREKQQASKCCPCESKLRKPNIDGSINKLIEHLVVRAFSVFLHYPI